VDADHSCAGSFGWQLLSDGNCSVAIGNPGTHERYVREWLGAMANAAYLEYDPTSARYALPTEHAPVLAQETGPVFFGGVHEEFVGLLGSFEKLLGHIRAGGGLNLDDYPDSMYEGIDRFTAGWFE